MKKMLFIMSNLNCGGAEKALVSLLKTIDYSKYEVDLLLFRHEGIFLKQVPKEVNILPEPFGYKYYDMSSIKAINTYVFLLINRFLLSLSTSKLSHDVLISHA